MKRGWYVSSSTSERRFDTRREAESAMRPGDFLHRECECGCGKSAWVCGCQALRGQGPSVHGVTSDTLASQFVELYVPAGERDRALKTLLDILEVARNEGDRKGLEFARSKVLESKS